VIVGAGTVGLLIVPLSGLPLWNRAFSLFPNPSLPLLGIVCSALWQRLPGMTVFNRADWRAIWTFGAAAGTALYLHPVIFGSVDLYYWGWDRERAVCLLAVLTVGLLGWGNRLGVLLLAALLGYALNALESQNCWDYVMDPIYWLMSVSVVTWRLVVRFVRAARTPAKAVIALGARGRTSTSG